MKKMKNKKASSNFYESGPEYLFFFLIIIGAILGIVTQDLIINYTIIFFIGIIIGINYYNHRYKRSYILTMLTIAIFLGYSIASINSNWRFLLILYVFGAILGYYIKKEKIMN